MRKIIISVFLFFFLKYFINVVVHPPEIFLTKIINFYKLILFQSLQNESKGKHVSWSLSVSCLEFSSTGVVLRDPTFSTDKQTK